MLTEMIDLFQFMLVVMVVQVLIMVGILAAILLKGDESKKE